MQIRLLNKVLSRVVVTITLLLLCLPFGVYCLQPTLRNPHFSSNTISINTHDASGTADNDYLLPIQPDQHSQLVLGLKSMQIEQIGSGSMVTGWTAHVAIKDGQHILKFKTLEQSWCWTLKFTVSTFSTGIGLIAIPPRSHYLEDRQVTTQIQWFNGRPLLGMNGKLISQEYLSINIKSILLLQGITMNSTVYEEGRLKMQLMNITYNLTHLHIQHAFSGITTVHFSILLFDTLELLGHSYYLDMNTLYSRYEKKQGSSLKLKLLGFYGLGQKEIQVRKQESYKSRGLVLRLIKIKCKGYWLMEDKKCIKSCHQSITIGTVNICLQRREQVGRWLQDCQSEDGGWGGWGGGGGWGCGGSTTTIVTCPASITNCLQCQLNHGAGSTQCLTCSAEYYRAGTSGICQPCSIGCLSCADHSYFGSFHIHCYSCHPTFNYHGSLHYCYCNPNQYTSYTTNPPTCVDCLNTCATCADNSTCITCLAGFYLSNSLCSSCMPVCKTCTASNTCSSCITGLVISGSVCACPLYQFLNPITYTCSACSVYDPNCQICAYDPVYDPASPVPVVCSVALVGYYVLSNGTTSGCGPDCDYCNTSSICTGCAATFSPSNGTCICSPLSLTNSIPAFCQNCTVIIPGCDLCTTNTTTKCSVCISNYFPDTSYPTTGCTACPSACSSCNSLTICTGCYAPFTLSGNDCLCTNASLFVSPARDTCIDCNLVIVNCVNCQPSLPTTCLSCASSSFVSLDGLQCIACVLNCFTCNATSCITCNPGYSPSNDSLSCTCDTTCSNCITSSVNNSCSSCTLLNGTVTSCTGCAAGWYLSFSVCLPCLPECLACSIGTECMSCAAPFIVLNTLKRCECNYTGLSYPTTNGASCNTCGSIINNCLACSVANLSTVCTSCNPGLYFNFAISQTQCLPCSFPCVTCTGSATYCDSCQVTYSHSPGTCYCDNSTQLFYSAPTLSCIACSSLIPNCLTCQSNALNSTITECIFCVDPYYADAGTHTCLQCSPTCLNCTDISLCSSCASNLIGNGTHCYCDLVFDPTLYYYSITNICISCLQLLTNCYDCTPQPLSCTNCTNGTYLSGGNCLICPSQCQTCDSLGCLSCPLGTTLLNQACVCEAQCTNCQLTVSNCLACSTNGAGVLTSCHSCLPGYEIGNSGINCVSCPIGCATCEGGAVCATCQLTFSLIGTSCECDASLNLYFYNDECQICGNIFYGCTQCSFSGSSTSCTNCIEGMYVNGTQCSFCNSNCLSCSSQFACTSCQNGMTLQTNGTCTCGAACINCTIYVTNCTSCQWTITGVFGQCTTCLAGTFLNSFMLCQSCPSPCITCDSSGNCSSCLPTLEVISGTCDCNSGKGLMMNTLNSLCESCSLYYDNCASCVSNISLAIGFNCFSCDPGYFWFNQTCTLEVCGDGYVSPSQFCDDGNLLSQDGCAYCQVQLYYNCTGSPSLCLVEMDFKITYDSIEVSPIQCNVLTVFFKLEPAFDSFNQANFSRMYAAKNYSKLQYIQNSFVYSRGLVGYQFQYQAQVLGTYLQFIFVPKFLAVPQTAQVPLYPIFFTITESVNTIQLKLQPQQVCSQKVIVNQYLDAVSYTSYGVLALSALPCKIVGLELFGVLQIAFLSMGSMDHLNPIMASMVKLSSTNGYKISIDKEESTNTRLLQTSSLTSNRVQTIGYASNFLRNCNIMFWIVCGVMILTTLIYLISNCFKCCQCFFGIAQRLFKQLVLTLILFNCFNFAYCSGLHFSYADRYDSLYLWGTVAAIASLVLPFLMVLFLQCSEEQGFGQYKDKFRPGKLQRAYFMITIAYRIGIGFYLSTANEDDLSTLLVLAMTLCFLLYNLVNLPFMRAYHNYRACICHLSQFLILFIAMYYRSMRSGSSVSELDSLFLPVYFQLGVLGICVLVSILVLIIQIYFWVISVKIWCSKSDDQSSVLIQNDTEFNQQNKNSINISNIHDQTSQHMDIIKLYN